MARILYPVSVQTFDKIYEFGYAYVDKTAYIHQLANPGGFFFLSRPRRFGKSLLISTMENYFRGNREMFRGLAIDRLEPGQWTSYPVLHLDFMRRGYKCSDDLYGVLEDVLTEWEKSYGFENPRETPDRRFDKLIRNIYRSTNKRVVILIDEYDKPVIDVSDNKQIEEENRRILHDFYGVMKANEGLLKFVFLTGVGKLGQINIFSGLNNLMDISLLPAYEGICGITTQELIDNFQQGINNLAQSMGITSDDALLELKKNYDGYHFSKELTDVYNPYSLIKALSYSEIDSYWFQSGTPTRLIRQFLNNDWGSPDLEGTVVSDRALGSGDVLGTNLALSCFYTGYLTIKSFNPRRKTFTLGYPNAEVRTGFFKDMMEAVKKWDSVRTDSFVDSLRDFIERDDIQGFLHELQSFLAGIPYMNETNRETQWQKDILIISRLVGANVEVEQRTSCGRIDMLLNGHKTIYIIEFKYGGSAAEALKQINDKNYTLPYENTLTTKSIVKVGVNISPETRTIDSWLIEPVDKA